MMIVCFRAFRPIGHFTPYQGRRLQLPHGKGARVNQLRIVLNIYFYMPGENVQRVNHVALTSRG